MSSSGITLICIASMLLSSACALALLPAAYGHNIKVADPNDPIGSENRVMLIQLSSFLSNVLCIFGLITMFSSS